MRSEPPPAPPVDDEAPPADRAPPFAPRQRVRSHDLAGRLLALVGPILVGVVVACLVTMAMR